jgi:hypothetical protein
MSTRQRRLALVSGAWLALGLLVLPASARASTKPDPSAPGCDLGTSTLMAGTALELSGTSSGSGELVGIMASREGGGYREGNVVEANGTWRAVIQFGAADAGVWAIDLTVDGRDCVSPLTVVLPAGMVAPATLAPADETLVAPGSAVDIGTIVAAAAVTGSLIVVGSWLFLVVLFIAAIAGTRPLARRGIRALARVATFIAVLGATLTIGLFFYFGVSMAHFDTGILPEQMAILDLGLAVSVIGGAVLGAIAARRISGGGPALAG